MSDDCHSIAQVGTNYARGLSYLETLGVKNLWTFERQLHPDDPDKASLVDRAVPLDVFREHFPS